MMIESAATPEQHTPPNRYNSFLLRCWQVGQGEVRIKIEHIQAGDATQVETYEAAAAWLAEHGALAAHVRGEPP